MLPGRQRFRPGREPVNPILMNPSAVWGLVQKGLLHMAKFISLLIGRSHQRLIGFSLWLLAFILSLSLLAVFAAHQVNATMVSDARLKLDPLLRLRANVLSTFDEMAAQLTAEPCTPEFHEQLRAVAFLPDGLNEFLYAPGGVAQCSVSLNFAPHALGVPDIGTDAMPIAFWFDRDLAFMGLDGHIGTIALNGPFGMVIPHQKYPDTPARWMKHEVVAVAPNGSFWHRNGTQGVHSHQRGAGATGAWLPLHNAAFYTEVCDDAGLHCVATEATLMSLLNSAGLIALAGIGVSALLAMGVAGQAGNALRAYWSFEARFQRNFTRESIICTYQPILSLSTGAIAGCEVLVRWRDIDGTVVFPDQFLPVVEKHGLGRRLTEFVVQRAYEELSRKVPPHIKLQVNFNVFPNDFDAAWLRDTLVIFENSGSRFSIVVEIVESDEIQIEHTQREIEALRRYGVRTHLDDFGSGYSNIQHLATLAIDGVKLDRSFAMSSDGSLMSKMLANAIEMVHAAGHRITVEGVETEERLRMVKATGQVEFVQGFLISRPLDIDRFVQFLGEQGVLGARPRLVA
ncbi:MAG: EAL domain-containing protein [Hyphomicrobiales bacterium]|nr:MAG: EAL domain-containing protein [Hyphomicrobiales bacterium]